MEQEENNDLEGSFFGTVMSMAEKIGVTIEQLQTPEKSQLKKLIKIKLNERMIQLISCAQPQMTKMRFLQTSDSFNRKDYVLQLKGEEAIQAMRIRLNMIPIYGNYRGDLNMKRLCPHCLVNDDTTEHILNCEVFQSTISSADIYNDNNIETWKQILEVTDFNLNHRTNNYNIFETKKRIQDGRNH